ncbi:hypothetical protein ALC56_09229, partial [Trachymyrmex septentrionalis]
KIANLRVQTLWLILKTKSLQAIGHGMLSSRWISTGGDTTRRRRRKRERSRLFNIEICNRCSLPSAAHYRMTKISRNLVGAASHQLTCQYTGV